ncbi:hypothetical protein BCR34DRAFT_595173 [Clohesyomyces aquaticus]|uniref:Uncharacterized protein n=1 Tax=Clohesyomyces aquaticus TaxID=1231657 RepID=A0A1Y2ABQ0_9PLEO|nr:hypothetical protein BCR34DRAFT_595173 [Clohesyomyces aquaticus]
MDHPNTPHTPSVPSDTTNDPNAFPFPGSSIPTAGSILSGTIAGPSSSSSTEAVAAVLAVTGPAFPTPRPGKERSTCEGPDTTEIDDVECEIISSEEEEEEDTESDSGSSKPEEPLYISTTPTPSSSLTPPNRLTNLIASLSLYLRPVSSSMARTAKTPKPRIREINEIPDRDSVERRVDESELERMERVYKGEIDKVFSGYQEALWRLAQQGKEQWEGWFGREREMWQVEGG